MRLALLVLAVCLAASCSAKNPNFCEGDQCSAVDAPIDSPPVTCTTNGPDPTCPAGNPICVSGACTGLCDADTDCDNRPATESVCHTGSGACVACDEDDAQANPAGGAEDDCIDPGMAVCDGTSHTCRACAAHAECASGICDAGRCAPEAEVIYMASTGNDGGDCGARATPCLTLNVAIGQVDGTHPYILMAGSGGSTPTTYQARSGNGTADFNAVDVTVIGYGAAINRSGMGQVLDVHAGADVRIEGLEISNATGVTNGTGVTVNAASLSLLEASVENNAFRGVSASSDSTLIIRRTNVVNNDGGGIFLDGGSFDITNSIIARNGDVGSSFGGVSLAPASTANVFAFNTVASNSAGVATADSIICTGATVTARNNIVVGVIPAQPRVPGSCNHASSLFTPEGAPAGANNMNIADQAMYLFTTDFHIGAGSVATNKADSANLTGDLLFDIDGDARAAGGATVDVGADEIP